MDPRRWSFRTAQSYGFEDQVLTIGGAEFQSDSGGVGYIGSDGYLYNNDANATYFHAQLSLPEGALIEGLCLYANDPGVGDVRVELVNSKLVPGGESPGGQVVGSYVESSNIGYGYYCTAPFTYTLRSKIDVDNDGIPDNVVHYVYGGFFGNYEGSLAVGAVQITWKRQVNPPPATPTFGDVPASDPAFAYIEALSASGITAGCAGGNYCPDAKLTRRQMAVFLAKALGLHWED